MKKIQEISPEDLGKTIIECIQEKKGREIVHLDLIKTGNSVCDYFIIAHADSGVQAKAIAHNIEDFLKKDYGIRALHSEGYDNAQWILLDYNTIVVHIFQVEIREYYKIEELWEDAELTRIKEEGTKEY